MSSADSAICGYQSKTPATAMRVHGHSHVRVHASSSRDVLSQEREVSFIVWQRANTPSVKCGLRIAGIPAGTHAIAGTDGFGAWRLRSGGGMKIQKIPLSILWKVRSIIATCVRLIIPPNNTFESGFHRW